MPRGNFDRVTTRTLLASLVLAGLIAAWLAIVAFGAVAAQSLRGDVSVAIVVASGSMLSCALWWAARDIVRLGFAAIRKR